MGREQHIIVNGVRIHSLGSNGTLLRSDNPTKWTDEDRRKEEESQRAQRYLRDLSKLDTREKREYLRDFTDWSDLRIEEFLSD